MTTPTPKAPAPAMPDRTVDRWIPEIGDRILVKLDNDRFTIDTCTARGRAKVGDQEIIIIIDSEGSRRRLEDCFPTDIDRPLNDSEIEILKAYVEQAIIEMLPEILDDALSTLAPHHKQQLWAALSEEQRFMLAIVRQMHQKPVKENVA